MKTNKWFPAIAIVILFLVIAIAAQTQRTNTARGWEYVEVQLSSTQSATPTLNKYGAEGWELVNVASGCSSAGASTGIMSCTWYAYFKRPK